MATPPDFTTGQVLTAAHMDAVGLWLVKTATLTASSNTITNAFNSDFENYRIIGSNINTSSTNAVDMALQMGTDNTANYDFGNQYIYGNGANAVEGLLNQTSGRLGGISQLDSSGFVLDIRRPNAAARTSWTYQGVFYQSSVAAYVYRQGYGVHKVATAYTSFTLLIPTYTLSGTVRVYGYRD